MSSLLRFRARVLGVHFGGNVVILNPDDMEELETSINERVRVKCSGMEFSATVCGSRQLIQRGEVGIPENIATFYGIADGDIVEVRPSSIPASIEYIKKKIDGKSLTYEEISSIVKDMVRGNLSDIEIIAFILSEQFHGMSVDEIEYLARAIAESGVQADFEEPVYDKHSIGGVPGNKVSLLIVPIVAAAGLLIPKTSSKAITSPAGTADTMEVLAPVEFSVEELVKIVKKTKGAIVWAGGLNICPADDIFIRVQRPLMLDPEPHMIASMMSKKIALGIDFLVIDIPMGKETKVETKEHAIRLARKFTELGERLNIHVECGITYGGQPVGHAVGPALEAREALLALEGKGPSSLIEKSTALAGILFEMGGLAPRGRGKDLAKRILESGRALKKMREIIEAQGGNPDIKPDDIPVGDHRAVIEAPCDGYVTDVSNAAITKIARAAGAPRDKGAGVVIRYKRGHKVKKGEPILEIYAERESKLSEAYSLAVKLNPITIEGMLLYRYPDFEFS